MFWPGTTLAGEAAVIFCAFAAYNKLVVSAQGNMERFLIILSEAMFNYTPYMVTLVCCAGMFAELCLLLYSFRNRRLRLLALTAAGVLSYLLCLAFFGIADYVFRLLVPFCVMGVAAVYFFFSELLPDVTKYHVWSFSIVFWYLYGAVLLKAPNYGLNGAFLVFCGVCTLAAALGLVLKGRAQAYLRPLLYLWYMLIIAVTIWAQFSGKALDFGEATPAAALPGPVPVFITGMMLMYLVVIFAGLFITVVLFLSDNRDFEGSKVNPRAIFRLKLADVRPGSRAGLVLLLVAQLALTAANYWLRLAPPMLVVGASLLLMPRLIATVLGQVQK